MGKSEYKESIELPEGVATELSNKVLTLNGKGGELSKSFADPRIVVTKEGNKISVGTKKLTQREKKIIKTYISHINNMIKGVTDGHEYSLKICSGHFPMSVTATKEELVVKNFIGEKVPRKLSLKSGAEVKIEGEMISVKSVDKEIAGQTAANIEQLTRRPGFDNRIFQDGIYIIKKSKR